MKKSKKIIFSILGASSLISLPLVAISCSKLTSKQKQVKSKIKQLLDMAKKIPSAGEIMNQYEKMIKDEEIAKLNDQQCDAILFSIDLVINQLKNIK
ncbi:hypothetical protein LLZ86_02430 [Metamycoplasma hominis]|uniref:hypothetical protein n=1 Tax=Metamycoplasma hominis TaxID=2098 RepID=UPI00193AADF9|nr:hypothetical protein [Metamycoplasma hominis]UIU37622.1 hypothetical protein LLZ86_02430 [Metamycoplasma hominis]